MSIWKVNMGQFLPKFKIEFSLTEFTGISGIHQNSRITVCPKNFTMYRILIIIINNDAIYSI